MNDFYISVKDMLNDFGVDIKVYPYKSDSNKPKYHYVGGIKVTDDKTVDDEAELRHEPVMPNSKASFMAQFLPGGEMAQADLIWISTKKYPINTVVEVASQGGKFRIMNYADYQDYSDAIIYELKGDDKHLNG